MAVETDGTVSMRGDDGPGVTVRITASEGRLSLVSGEEVLGDWDVEKIGLHAVPDGFAIRAEGEEFVLRAEDPVALAEELGMTAVTPRLARKVATANNPEPRELPPEPDFSEMEKKQSANVMAIAFALGGALVLFGGTFLRNTSTVQVTATPTQTSVGGVQFWAAFIVGGLLMVGLAYVIALGSRWARLGAVVVLVGVIALFGYMLSVNAGATAFLTAYGFIAGGIVVGVAVLFSGSLGAID